MKLKRICFMTACLVLGSALLAAAGGLNIVPIFSESITSDADAATIENVINSAITTVDGLYSNPVTVDVTFNFTSAGSYNLASSEQDFYAYSYSSYTAALRSDSTDNPGNAALATAVANLSKGNDSNGAKSMAITYAQALMLSGYGLATPARPQFNPLINVNSIQSWAQLGGGGYSYDMEAALEHEIDEVLGGGGAGSTLNNIADGCIYSVYCDKYGATDLYRYSAADTPSFTTDGGASAYLSVDGGTTSIVAFNQDSNGDFGDFGPLQCETDPSGGQLIQNAFQCSGLIVPFEAYTTSSPEFTMLSAIGWDHSDPQAAAPGSLLLLELTLLTFAIALRWRDERC